MTSTVVLESIRFHSWVVLLLGAVYNAFPFLCKVNVSSQQCILELIQTPPWIYIQHCDTFTNRDAGRPSDHRPAGQGPLPLPLTPDSNFPNIPLVASFQVHILLTQPELEGQQRRTLGVLWA
jgi:hypothetical protein